MSGEHAQVPSVMVTQAPGGPGIVAAGAIADHQQHLAQHHHHQPRPQPHSIPHQQQQGAVQVQLPVQVSPQQQGQAQSQQSHPDMSAMKLTRGTSCVLCQQRKVRCDKNKPCANCVKARVECRVIPPQPPRRRKKRLQEKDLIDRLKKYEALLSENGVKFESIGADLRVSGQTGGGPGSDPADDVGELENEFEGLKTSPGSSTSPSVDSRSRSQSDKPFKWFPFHKEFRASEELLRDSSEDEVDGSTIHHAFDKMYENQDGFPFIIGGRNSSVTHYHPSPIHIFQLWQIYINNVNPLLRITHIPTVQGQIIEASSKLEKTSKATEALMFAIYLMAVTSMEEDDVRRMFDEQKTILITKYHTALQQALINAGFMRTNDLTVLQAYTLYLIAVRQFMDPRQIFCLIGVAVRIGQRMGLHRDAAPFGLSPFEVEQRRRLWWTLVGYDRRIGEMTGSTVTALSSGGDCRLPLNINDTDLHIDGKDAPTPHTGPTEMLFCLTRLELAMAVGSDSQRDSNLKGDGAGPGTPGSAPARPTPIPTVRIANQENISYTLDGFFEHMEKLYLRHCDPKIPLHFFTLTMTRQSLCKMRVISFLVRLGQGDTHPLNDQERDMLFLEATQMIEYDNVVQSAESLQGYKWYTYLHFPFPAYMFLVTELRQRTTGPMVERAWDAITENHDRRGLMNNLHSPMHLAFGRLFIKAWDAREAAEAAAGRQVVAPRWILKLKANAEKRIRNRGLHPSAGAVSGRPDIIPGQGPPFGKINGMAMSGIQTSPEESSMMMTPPVDASQMAPGSAGGPGMVQGQGQGQQEDFDMDWATIMDQYNMGGMGGMGAFGGFGFVPGVGGGVPPQDGDSGMFPGGG